MASNRVRIIKFRASPQDAKDLARLARHHNRKPSDVLRRLIADEVERLRGTLKQSPKKETEHGSEKEHE